VNHEIYGGLYAQRIFGESFEEPASVPPIRGWRQYGGEWTVRDGVLHVMADAGAKLVRTEPGIADGSVECDVRFDDSAADNAGLTFADEVGAIPSGLVGIRTWQSNASFRNLVARTDGRGVRDSLTDPETNGHGTSGMWDAVLSRDADARFEIDAANPFHGMRS